MPRPVLDLTGNKYGKLIVLKLNETLTHRGARWLCKCECGAETIAYGWELKSSKKKSCGCLVSELAKVNKNHLTHGFSKTRFYRIWVAMKRRCSAESNELYKKYYIDKGITVCKEWLDFENFKNDMYETYSEHCSIYGEKDTSIDRIDNDKGYSKENCRWATMELQNQNKSNKVVLL